MIFFYIAPLLKVSLRVDPINNDFFCKWKTKIQKEWKTTKNNLWFKENKIFIWVEAVASCWRYLHFCMLNYFFYTGMKIHVIPCLRSFKIAQNYQRLCPWSNCRCSNCFPPPQNFIILAFFRCSIKPPGDTYSLFSSLVNIWAQNFARSISINSNLNFC